MFAQHLLAFRIFFTAYSMGCVSGIRVALLSTMNTRVLIILIFSAFLFDTIAEARSCRSCSGVRRGGPVRRWVQSRRSRRSCRSCQPRRCGNGSCGQGGGNPSFVAPPGGGHGGGSNFDPGIPSDPGPSASQTPETPPETPAQPPDDSEAPEAPGIPGDEEPKREERADACLEKLEKNAKVLVASAAVKQEDAEAQKNARSFLEILEGAKKTNADFGQVESPKRMYYFLKELTKKDPFSDEESPWYTAQGMYMPQNYQNLVKTLGQFGAASERETQLKVLEESMEHLGWLTSSYAWPQRGSNLTDRRHFYERSQTWVECLKKTPEAPPAEAQAQAPAPEEKPQAPEQKPEAPQPPAQEKQSSGSKGSDAVALGQALYQSKCVGCHLSNGIEVSSFEFASKRVGNRSMPPKGAPPLSPEEITNLQAFFATQ